MGCVCVNCGKIYLVMAKIKQRNWLLIITGCLVLASGLILIMTGRGNLENKSCYYDGHEYLQNQLLPNYTEGKDCYCSKGGKVVCDESLMSYEDFSSEGLGFSSSFRNFLEKEMPDPFKVALSGVTYQDGKVEIILEREALCGELGEPPVQTAIYKKEDEGLTLTTITNTDENLYNRVCSIGNIFVVENLDLSQKEDYSIYYQDDRGRMFNLNVCFVNGKLYGQEDVFKDSQEEKLCTCVGPDLECVDL